MGSPLRFLARFRRFMAACSRGQVSSGLECHGSGYSISMCSLIFWIGWKECRPKSQGQKAMPCLVWSFRILSFHIWPYERAAAQSTGFWKKLSGESFLHATGAHEVKKKNQRQNSLRQVKDDANHYSNRVWYYSHFDKPFTLHKKTVEHPTHRQN